MAADGSWRVKATSTLAHGMAGEVLVTATDPAGNVSEATRLPLVIDTVGKRTTGTTVRFRPDPRYFDTVKFAVARLTHLLRAKAVLCPGLTITFHDEASGQREVFRLGDAPRCAEHRLR